MQAPLLSSSFTPDLCVTVRFICLSFLRSLFVLSLADVNP